MSEVNINYKGSTIASMDASGTKTLQTSGKYCEDDVEVVYTRPTPPVPSYQTKSVTPSESAQTVTADSGYDALEEVDVGAISSTYVGSGITRRSSTDLTESGDTVTVPAGYYESQATKSVASGTAGTPTATKGAVSNHAVSVTPSVTNTAGYISGGTKTGTAVSVSASELVSGTKSISANGTDIDVTNYASVDVAVPTGGGGFEYEEGIWIPEANTYREGVSFSNSHTKAPSIVIMADVTGTAVSGLSNLSILFVGVNCTDLFGNGFPYGATTTRDYFASYAYRTTAGSSAPSCGGYANISNTSGSTEQYVEYWATNTEFYPYTRSTSRNWIAGRTYKWLAIWK